MELIRFIIECLAIISYPYWIYRSNRHETKIINLMRSVELLEQENRRRAMKERKEI